MVTYPTARKIEEINYLVLKLVKVKRADRPEVLNRRRLGEVLDACESSAGDAYKKAAILLKGIISSKK